MDIQDLPASFIQTPPNHPAKPAGPAPGEANFRSQLLQSANASQPPGPRGTPRGAAHSLPTLPSLDRIAFGTRAAETPPQTPQTPRTTKSAAGAYEKQHTEDGAPPTLSGVAKYKDDQLLSNPGGDHYDLENGRYVADPPEQKSFWGRVGKDIKDAVGNVKNFFGNLLFGSKIHYRDENGEIQEARQRGLVGSVVDFFQDLGSALSFGTWRPDGEEAPQGFGERVVFFFSKLKEAVFGDLVQGVAGSVIHMAEDLALAGWNLLETLPDATIGNFEAGRKATTSFFDNGQVALDYLTDVLPGGEASVRVHSPDLKNGKFPFLNNLDMPERNPDDTRWKYVRNTPFRKGIETVGTILFDILSLKFLGDLHLFGEKQDHPE